MGKICAEEYGWDAENVDYLPCIFVQMYWEYGIVEYGYCAGEEHGVGFALAFAKAVMGLYESDNAPDGDGYA